MSYKYFCCKMLVEGKWLNGHFMLCTSNKTIWKHICYFMYLGANCLGVGSISLILKLEWRCTPTRHPSCTISTVEVGFTCFYESLKVYSSVYAVSKNSFRFCIISCLNYHALFMSRKKGEGKRPWSVVFVRSFLSWNRTTSVTKSVPHGWIGKGFKMTWKWGLTVSIPSII